ncbi:MAG: hypothetical protein KatS3mg024_1094 [Armatimonadota bacterium]|nr:MAG: hypothetical protein KatS3mg024_1094 [Armatimonadota bacterium]
MLIASIIIAWIAFVVVMSLRAMRSAVDPPLVQCFDCDRESCSGCPYLEQSVLEEDLSYQEYQEERLAA